jgi:hypothetical protein
MASEYLKNLIKEAMKEALDNTTQGTAILVNDQITETTTSAPIDCRGYNCIRLETTVNNAIEGFSIKSEFIGSEAENEIYGSIRCDGSFGGCYAGVAYTDGKYIDISYSNMPSFVKIKSVIEGTGTATIKATPCNV